MAQDTHAETPPSEEAMGDKPTLCIGFGEYDNRLTEGPGCQNVADTPAKLWCQSCERLRLEHLSKSFANITEAFDRMAAGEE